MTGPGPLGLRRISGRSSVSESEDHDRARSAGACGPITGGCGDRKAMLRRPRPRPASRQVERGRDSSVVQGLRRIRGRDSHFLKPGQPLDRRSLAYDYFEGGDVPTKPELVAAGAWLSDSRIDERATIVEESRPMPSYGGVLTLLWIRDPIDTPPDEDGSLLEPLAPEDFTLRRRRWPRR